MDKPIRVLNVLGRMDRGGAETVVMNLYRQIDRTKIQFDFVVHTSEKCAFDDEIELLGGRIHRVPHYKGKNHIKYRNSWISFFESHPEYRIIHAHLTTTAAIFLNIAKKYKIITIVHAHNNTPISEGFIAIIKNCLRYPLRYIADYFLACSRTVGLRLCGKNFDIKKNSYIFKNAINVDQFKYDEKIREKKRLELNLNNKFVIGHVGSFSPPKNHEFIINIFNEISKKDVDAVLLLVGDGEARHRSEEKVNDLGLSEHVIFLGIRQDIPQLLQAMDVFIFPSFYEGFGVALVEAQASGMPCVASDTISCEIEITNLVSRLSLKGKKEHWVDMILEASKQCNRKGMASEIKSAGYDVKETTSWLHDFYFKIHKSYDKEVLKSGSS